MAYYDNTIMSDGSGNTYYPKTKTNSVYNSDGTKSLETILSSIDTDGDGIVDNADKLDGKHASEFATSTHIHTTLPAKVKILKEDGFNEGGELTLEKSVNSTLSGDITIDTMGNNLRFIETGGTYRGAYIDIGTTEAGVASKIWHSGNDGSGSGLDADKLDGLDSTAFMKVNTTVSSGSIYDCVAVINQYKAFMTTVTSGVTNMPSAGNTWTVWYIPSGTNSAGTLFAQIWNDSTIWSMSVINTTFGNWAKQWSSINDGSGSGLDADLWDGFQASNRTNWSTNNVKDLVVGQLGWKNYGNNHTIFDASQGTSPDGTAISSVNSQFAWGGTFPTLMGWNGASTYGVRVDSARVADSASNQIFQTTVPTSLATGAICYVYE